MTGPEGNSEFCFPRISMFPETSSRETLRFKGNKIQCSPRDQSLSDLLYSKTKQKQNLKTALRFQQSHATAVNISRVTMNCFHSFHNVARSWHLAGNSFIVRCHVTMNQPMNGHAVAGKRQLYNNVVCYPAYLESSISIILV